MGESLDDMIAWSKFKRERAKADKVERLASADTKGWQQLSVHHFRRALVGGGFIDWWPSTGKFTIAGKGARLGKGRYRVGNPMTFIAQHQTLDWSE